MPKKPRVAYYFDTDVGAFSYGLGHVMKPHRIKMTHSLIAAYDLLPKLNVLRPTPATPEQMTKFHSDDYIHFLKRVTPDTANELTDGGTKYCTVLAGMDNPAYEGAFEFCSISAGGSISSAQALSNGSTDIAINWAGGLHHAKRTGASGFCYINDIVLGILELLRTFPRVLYVDIDCHHGDAVEEAFYSSERVLTCSLHKFGDFFPGTGLCDDRGVGKGWKYSINVPFRSGLSDENFHSVYVPLMDRILARFRPSAVVLQCGADSLAGDRLGQYNVSMDGHADCVRYFKDKGLPLMVLGGGGYTIRNVARTWCYETACIVGVEKDLDKNLPYNTYFEYFGPEYKLEVKATNMDDLNESDRYLEGIRETVLRQADEIPIAPSVGIHMPPRHSVAEELGLGLDGANHVEGDYDDIDLRIQELATQFLGTADAPAAPAAGNRDSDTESMGSDRDGYNGFAEGMNEDDDDVTGTPTRGRRRGVGNRVGGGARTNGTDTPNRFARGTIPMPSPAMLFSGNQTPASNRPPDSAGSVFGAAGRQVIGGGGLSSALGLGAEYAEFEGGVASAMESGAGSGTLDAFRDFAAAHEAGQGRHKHDENQEVRAGEGERSSRRFFKSSGIKLRGTTDVTFPLAALNGPVGASYGPSGFIGFGNEAHVMKRGFGLVYGGWGNTGVGAGGVEAQEEEPAAPAPATNAGSGRRSRYRRGAAEEEEEMDVDGGEESD